jgi:hypothetical protein
MSGMLFLFVARRRDCHQKLLPRFVGQTPLQYAVIPAAGLLNPTSGEVMSAAGFEPAR